MPGLRVIPLGGLGEFGLNSMVLESGEDRVLIDCGLMFPTAQMPGVGTVMPDLSYLLEHPERLRAVVLTHGHEDHVGALSSLLSRISVPVYGLPFTLELAKSRLQENGVPADLRAIGPKELIKAGDALSFELFRVVHSMPDAAGVAFRTPEGTVIHTGDFKLDDSPTDGLPTDLERLGELGDEGVTCLLSDSTGAEHSEPTASEREVEHALDALFQKATGRIIVSMFASNVHRLRHTLELCARTERRVVLAGRSLARNVEIARNLGLIDIPSNLIIPMEDTHQVPREKVVILATGSQAEPRSALVQMALGTLRVPASPSPAAHLHSHAHPPGPDETDVGRSPFSTYGLTIQSGDLVIISSRAIPGNERLVGNLIDAILERGATVVYGGSTRNVHVSGHATRPQQRRLIEAVRPKNFVPIHGELKQLYAHLGLARESGVAPEGLLLARDGDMLEFDGGRGYHAGQTSVGRVLKDRWGNGELDESALSEREKLAELGVVVAALVVDRSHRKILSGPHLEGRGLSIEESRWLPEVAAEVRRGLEDVSPALLGDDAFVRDELSRAVRKSLKLRTRKRSQVLPVVVHL